MGSVLSLMGSVLSSLCSPSLLLLPPAPPASPTPSAPPSAPPSPPASPTPSAPPSAPPSPPASPTPSAPPSVPPSPPPPPTPPQIKSDVFLSFRGRDTRNNFVSHLHKALVNKQIVTFIDDNLNRGEEISQSLLKAIEESQIAIIIFSKDYASSRWCLNELVKILECRENHGQIVIPVFYKIEPSEVRKQTGCFEDAFVKHQNSNENSSQVLKWKGALKLAGNISGFDLLVVKSESALIEEIVQKVLEYLKRQNNVSPSVNKKLVGIESRINDIELLLGIGDQTRNDVRSIGIWGLGGIGKTTLAKAVCEKISYQFEGFHFVESVRETLEKKDPKCLQQELYLEILGDKNAYNHQLTKIRFSRMKLLIILDDVTSSKQVDDLIGDLDCFGLGSRIIITSRDQQVLKNYGMDHIYEVKELSFDNALKLFCQHAFKENCPGVGYMELSKDIVKNVRGVPLALKVLGSFLLDKRKEVWESSMKKLENSLDNDICKVLKISYDGLDSYQKSLFLDIACFYKGWDVKLVITIMDASGFCTENDLSALEDKCLIIKLDNKLMMHDLLQALGKTIVQQESVDPGERTRLWNHNDICDVLTNATGTRRIEGISLDMSNSGDIHLHRKAFRKMHNLRLLQFYISDYWRDNNNKMHVPQDYKFPLTKLRYFLWERYPLKSLQLDSHLANLVILKLPYSNVEQLWSDVKQFNHLKEIYLDGSKKLIRIPDLWAPNLERLNLNGCASLIEMPSSFQHLIRLMNLSLSSCENLTSVPQLPKSLNHLYLSRCSKLQRLPELPNSLERLDLEGCSSLIEIPSSIQHLTKLNSLALDACISLNSLPDCTGLISLQNLLLSHCSKLERLPDLPNNLVVLDLEDCSKLQMLPELPNNLEKLHLKGCSSLIKIPLSIQHLTALYYLDLRNCQSLTSIPDCTGLWSLRFLQLSNCSKLERLPEIPNNFKEFDLEGCTSLFEIPSSFQHLSKLWSLTFKGCESLTNIPDLMGLKSLTSLTIKSCSNLKMLPEFPNSIEELLLKKIPIEELPPSCERLCTLLKLYLIDCPRLKSLPSIFCAGKSLESLILKNCPQIGKLPSIDLLHNLTELCLSECGITEIPDSVCCLTSLESLELDGNSFEIMPESIISLSNLSYLDISYCKRLKVLPKLPWAHIDAHNCTSLQELSCPSFPNDFFALKSSQFMSAQFVNCFKLDKNSLYNFMKDTQREIQAQSPLSCEVYEGEDPPLDICYPGNEIPEWFDFQSIGSFIDVMSLDWINYNFLCFALCAFVSFPDQFKLPNNLPDRSYVRITYNCYVKSKERGPNWDTMYGVLGGFSIPADCSTMTSHVTIGFGFHFLHELHDNEFTFQFNSSCKVEKCGIHLTFGKNLEKSDQNKEVDELHSEESTID